MRGNGHYEMERPSYWYPRQGEVYLCELDKVRPAIVVSDNRHNQRGEAVVVVPLTTKENGFGRSFALTAVDTGLDTRSWAKPLETKEVAHAGFVGEAKGQLKPAKLQELLRATPMGARLT